ncbi:N-acetyltransferase [Clostridium aminobutyricum]|uniref:N-acetyltransferase n=1 Tax=Clostridium aminobutyricum TaxID=33953 RepID=A0A939D999_CLOAM|nr:N-acetyltransferase [Clostridium aminobutyricum]MBN7773475.1 N-acetyltransferase [Clostridium aminobutyricum]
MIVRKAKLSDSETIHKLANYYADKGLLLARSRSSIYENIRNYSVVEIDGEVIGVGALSTIWSDLAEIRTLAVEESLSGKGIGRKLMEYFISEAKEMGIQKIFTLTYQNVFFEKCGFIEVDKDYIPPHKLWKDCYGCPKFPDCDEILMVMEFEKEK